MLSSKCLPKNSVKINNGAQSTESKKVNLTITAAPNIVAMAVSREVDAKPIVKEPVVSEKKWDLCTTESCSPGLYKVFVNFFNTSNTVTETVSTSIILEGPLVLQNEENIQACLNVTPKLSNSLVKFNKNLAFKQTDPDVKALQVFLNRNGFIIAPRGEGSVGNETTYFGSNTRNQLKRFQTVYKKLIEGYFQPIQEIGVLDKPTRDFINSITTWGQDVCQRTTPPLPPPILPPVLLPLPPDPVPGLIIYPAPTPAVKPPVTGEIPAFSGSGGGGGNSSVPPQIPPSTEPVATSSQIEVATSTPAVSVVNEVTDSSLGGGIIDFLKQGPIGSTLSAILNFVGDYDEENFPGLLDSIKNINEAVAYVVVPVTTAVLYATPLQENLIRIASTKDIWLLLTQAIQSLLAFLGIRRVRRYWGTVYDSKSKQPIDPAIVQLVDAQTGIVVEEVITDMAGRYGFLVRSGKFFIRVEKTNYAFPSRNITGKNDEIFDNLYYGEEFSMSDISNLIVPNIPMDPVNFDWNQMDKKRIINIHPHTQYAFSLFVNILYWSGFAASLFFYVREPSVINLVTFCIYIAALILSVLLSYIRLWGSISSSNGNSVSNLLVELVSPQFDTVVMGKAKTALDGKFFLKAFKGQYKLNIKKIDPVSKELVLVDSKAVTVGKAGVFNEDVYLR